MYPVAPVNVNAGLVQGGEGAVSSFQGLLLGKPAPRPTGAALHSAAAAKVPGRAALPIPGLRSGDLCSLEKCGPFQNADVLSALKQQCSKWNEEQKAHRE